MQPRPNAQSEDGLNTLARITAAIQAGTQEEQAAQQCGISRAQLQELRQNELKPMATLAGLGKLSRSLRFTHQVIAEQKACEALAREARRKVLPAETLEEPPRPENEANLIELEPQTLPAQTWQAPAPETIPEPALVQQSPSLLHTNTGHRTIAIPAISDIDTSLPFIKTIPETQRTPETDQKSREKLGEQSYQNAATPWAKPIQPPAETPPPPIDLNRTSTTNLSPFIQQNPLPFHQHPQKQSPPPPEAQTLNPAELERIQKITLAQYAYICALTRAHRGDIAEILQKFSMSPALWKALHTLWRERFTNDPVLKQRCEILIEKRINQK